MLEPGQSFAHFTIVRLLGEGGMGQVYLAQDQKLHREVALKILTWKEGDDDDRVARFQREAKTAAQVSHPNVMAIYDIDVAKDATGNDVTFIVMEYVKGRSLSDYLKLRPSDISTVVKLAEKIASGLAAAHKINVVHRDIKSDNILVDDDDQPKILDFGLAKPVQPVKFAEGDSTRTVSKELTRVGKIVGTVSYMSPEQIRGESVDIRSDIFSFGVLLYRMATGEFPFTGPTEVSTLAKILEARHESIRVRNETIPMELERIVDKCLQKDPNDRYQDTRDLVVDLRNLRRLYESGTSDSISALHSVPKQTKVTKSWILDWKTGLIVLAVIALVWKIFFSGGASLSLSVQAKPNSLAILEFENKTGDAEFDWMETGVPEMLLTDLAQNQEMNLISRQRILEMLGAEKLKGSEHSSEASREIAGKLGATNVLTGTLFRVGKMIRIDARLEEAASGRVLMGEKVMGEDPFVLVDSLTEKIAMSMNLGSTSTTNQDIRKLTSASPEAFKYYVLGMENFGKGLHEEAIANFEKAISYDSTFALPYMRIGMANAFQQRPKQATLYLKKALEYQAKLPVRERSLLDVYADLWVLRKFDDAFAKMRTLVSNYPEDIEARTIYGILVYEFTKDTAKAFAQFDSVLALNPTYQLPQEIRSQSYLAYGKYDEAIRIAEKIKQEHPDSPGPYTLLGTAYLRQGKREQAEKEFASLLARQPNNKEALSSLIRLAIYRRDFARAEELTERFKDLDPGNLYNLVDYYDQMAALCYWKGQFRAALKQYELEVGVAEQLNDSNILSSTLQTAASGYLNAGLTDSGLSIYRRAYQYRTANMFSNYALVLVDSDHSKVDEARKFFRQDIADFKSRIPSELWGLTDGLEKVFEGLATLDSNLLLDGYRDLVRSQQQGQNGNDREMSYLLIKLGKYQEGIDILKRFVSGEEESSGGYSYPMALYYLGLGYEGIGNKPEAIRNLTEMLKYWGNADIQIDEIKDAKARLAKLTS